MKKQLEFYQNLRKIYDEMNYRRQSITFQFEEEIFSREARGINKFYHEVLTLMKYLQTKPQIQRMNIIYYDLYNTVKKLEIKRKL